MVVAERRVIDELGRLVIPKAYLEFYNINKKDKVCLIATPEGILVTNSKYKVVKIEESTEK